MKKKYRDYELEAYRARSLGGETLLYYSTFTPEGVELMSGFTAGSETPREYIRLMEGRVDDEIKERTEKGA